MGSFPLVESGCRGLPWGCVSSLCFPTSAGARVSAVAMCSSKSTGAGADSQGRQQVWTALSSRNLLDGIRVGGSGQPQVGGRLSQVLSGPGSEAQAGAWGLAERLEASFPPCLPASAITKPESVQH